jgi:UDP-N-acetylmuramyl tripeptide synthase
MKARVPGRMEVYTNADGKLVAIVDYAHNRMSFEKLFQSSGRSIPAGRWCRLRLSGQKSARPPEGSGRGLRPVRRPRHPHRGGLRRGADGTDLRRDASPRRRGGCDYSILPDRGEAVATAVLDCDGPTVLLITGKGRRRARSAGASMRRALGRGVR